MERLYTVKEVAELLSVTQAAIYKWVQRGQLKVVYAGSSIRVRQSAIEEFIQTSTAERDERRASRLANDATIDDTTRLSLAAA